MSKRAPESNRDTMFECSRTAGRQNSATHLCIRYLRRPSERHHRGCSKRGVDGKETDRNKSCRSFKLQASSSSLIREDNQKQSRVASPALGSAPTEVVVVESHLKLPPGARHFAFLLLTTMHQSVPRSVSPNVHWKP